MKLHYYQKAPMEETNESTTTTLVCPECGCEDITRSKRKGIIDKIMSPFGFVPYRCDNYYCHARFYSRLQKKQ